MVGRLKAVVRIELLHHLISVNDPCYGRKTAQAVIVDRVELEVVFRIDKQLGSAGILPVTSIGDHAFQIMPDHRFVGNRVFVPERVRIWIVGYAELNNILGLDAEKAVVVIKTCCDKLV